MNNQNDRITIEIKGGIARNPVYRLRQPVDLQIREEEQIAVVGDNGSGKNMLIDIITSSHPLLMTEVKYDFGNAYSQRASDNIKMMTFRDSYGTSADSAYYYQKRWNQTELDDSPKVADMLDEEFRLAEETARRDYGDDEAKIAAMTEARVNLRDKLYHLFNMQPLLDKHAEMLSSGELRKLQLTKVLITMPRLLIIDNPFIGLDVNARKQLRNLLNAIVEKTGMQLILMISKSDDLPDFITHVIEMKDMTMMPKVTLVEYNKSRQPIISKILTEDKENAILGLPYQPNADTESAPGSKTVVEMRKVNIRYGERTILKDLSMTVKNGERWALEGENGAGKSTLLSIVCADNPQSYANDIVLFGNQRGTGETIWDIKKRIGFISPEMFRAYKKDLPAVDIVASGLNDSIGLYKRPNEEQKETCKFWMDIFGIGNRIDTPFLKMSSGEQRLVMLARTFVKDPELLILDEPLHGLDLRNRQLVKDVIEAFCKRKNKTLIMVTHYKEELPKCIDHEIYLKKTTN